MNHVTFRPEAKEGWALYIYYNSKVLANPLVQLNEYEIDLYYLKLSQHMMTDCLLIYGFLPVLVCCDLKIVLHWYENQNKNNFVIMCCKSLEILKQYHVISMLTYRNYNSVWRTLSCNTPFKTEVYINFYSHRLLTTF